MKDGLEAIFRWMHVFAGIIWIGHLYFFNWVNGPLAAKLDGPTKKVVVPELMPRALYWFRWGAAWTWVTGILLLGLVYYHGMQAFAGGVEWSAGAGIMTSEKTIDSRLGCWSQQTIGNNPYRLVTGVVPGKRWGDDERAEQRTGASLCPLSYAKRLCDATLPPLQYLYGSGIFRR